MSEVRRAWLRELEHPTAGFFQAFAARVQEEDGARRAAREAVSFLAPRIDWTGYLPLMPHGLLGLAAVFRLRPVLAESSFLRALGTQLHALAGEGRAAETLGLSDSVEHGTFRRLARQALPDMANVGHRAIALRALGSLAQTLEDPGTCGILQATAHGIAASGPVDRFWHDRMVRRLQGAPTQILDQPAVLPPEAHATLAREICDLGLLPLLDRLAERLKAGLGAGDLLAALTLAASERQLEARRELEGATSWAFVYLATLADLGADGHAPEAWGQAAALVNFFPADDEQRVQPKPPVNSQETALDAILDGEAPQALFLAEALRRAQGDEVLLRILAEAASANDPVHNHGHQLLTVAAAVDLVPHLPEQARSALLAAQAKALAASQGSGELGRLLDRALAAAPHRS